MTSRPSPSPTLRLFVGTYTNDAGSEGVYVLDFDKTNGALGAASLWARLKNPTFLALHPRLPVLYVGTELETAGGFVALRTDGADSENEPFSAQAVQARNTPCHVTISPDGRTLAGANYHAGWVATLPVATDGTLGAPESVVEHKGQTGPRRSRQDKPHAHSAQFSPDGRTLYVCDLGLDAVFAYRVDAGGSAIALAAQSNAAAGAGPRHSRTSVDGRYLYVLNELSSTLDVFSAASEGGLSLLESHSTLPVDFTAENICAEVCPSPDGRFVYVSNRGHDSIAVFTVHNQSGRLERTGIVSCGGRHPRHFTLSPDGRWLLCANRDSNQIQVFSLDLYTGLPAPVGAPVRVPQAVCLVFDRSN